MRNAHAIQSLSTYIPSVVVRVFGLLSLLVATHSDASVAAAMTAEFAELRGSQALALTLYQQEAIGTTNVGVIERSLSLATQHKDYVAAIAIAKHWTEVQPNNVVALFYLAHLALQQGEFAVASGALDHILQLSPDAKLDRVLVGINPADAAARDKILQTLTPLSTSNNPSLLVLIAGLLTQNNRANDALPYLDAALKQRPNNMAYISLKAKTLLALNQREKLNLWLVDLVKKRNQNKAIWLFQLRYLLIQKAYLPAQKQLLLALRKWPNDPELIFLSSSIDVGLGEYANAQKSLLKLIPFEQYQDQAYFNLGMNAGLQLHSDEADGFFNQAGGEFFRPAQTQRAMLLMRTLPVDAVIAKLTETRLAHPEQATFLYELQTQILNESNQRAAAMTLLDQALQQESANTELMYLRFLLLRPDEFAQKEQLLKTLLDLAPNNPSYLNAYAFTLADQNTRLKQARFLIDRALSITPNQIELLDTLGVVQYRQKNYTDAVNTLERAYAGDETVDHTLAIGLHLLDALAAAKQTARMKTVAAELVARYPNHPDVQSLVAKH